jgi:hypothetical protein
LGLLLRVLVSVAALPSVSVAPPATPPVLLLLVVLVLVLVLVLRLLRSLLAGEPYTG